MCVSGEGVGAVVYHECMRVCGMYIYMYVC